jgi:hypothetical protein
LNGLISELIRDMGTNLVGGRVEQWGAL